MLEIFIFSINLYLFPIDEIFSFIVNDIISELHTRDGIDSLSDNNKAVFSDTMNHFEKLREQGRLDENITIKLSYETPSVSSIENVCSPTSKNPLYNYSYWIIVSKAWSSSNRTFIL